MDDISRLYHVAENRTDTFIPATDSRDVNSRVRAVNRKRKKIVKEHEDTVMGTSASAFPHPLELVKVCPSYDPPGIHVNYCWHYHEQAYDSKGNPIGSQEEWDWQEYYRLRKQFGEDNKPSAPSAEAEQALMKRLGLSEEDMPAEQSALREAEKQKRRPLTDTEREHIIQATAPPADGDII